MVQDAEVDAQLRRILTSTVFSASARSRQFLEYCVERSVQGDSPSLKETTIAVEVFLRAADYDPKSDPIVRVHARRVREKLDVYYKTTGVDDPIRIDLPKGGYVAHIQRTLPRRKTDFTDWQTEPAANSEERPVRRRGTIPVLTAVALVLLLFAVWAASAIVAKANRAAIVNNAPMIPVNLGANPASEVTWSPDGRSMAYTAESVGGTNSRRTHIFVTRYPTVGQTTELQTKDPLYESHPVWSPDGREIAFVQAVDTTHFRIVRYKIATGESQFVGTFQNFLMPYTGMTALDWSPGGDKIVTSEQTGPSSPARLVLVSLLDGKRTPLTTPPSISGGDMEAKFSPDGQSIAFHRGGRGDLYLMSVVGEQVQPARKLTVNNPGVRGIAWTRDGNSILFGTENPGTLFGIHKISRDGEAEEAITPPNFSAVSPALNREGLLAFEHPELVTALVAYNIRNGEKHSLLDTGGDNAAPMFSPDGHMLAYVTTHSGCEELWLSRNHTAAVQVTHFACTGLVFLPSWSPDSRSLTFSFRDHGATNLFVYDVASQALRQITSTQNRDINSVYSGDGRFLYYSSNDDGTPRIWRLRTDNSSRAEPLFIEAVLDFAPSPDGHWLYFLRAGEELTLLRRSLDDGTTEEFQHFHGRPTFLNGFVFANDHIFLPLSDKDGSSSDVYEIDPSDGKSQIVLRLQDLSRSGDIGPGEFSMSPDGTQLAVAQVQQYASTLYTLQTTQ